MVQKKCVVRQTFEYVDEMPDFWEEHDYKFKCEESSSCASNIIDDIIRAAGGPDEDGDTPCACDQHVLTEVVRTVERPLWGWFDVNGPRPALPIPSNETG